MKHTYTLLVLLCAGLFGLPLSAQQIIRMDTMNYSIDELVQDVLVGSDCANVSNVQFTGQNPQIGFFDQGNDAINLASGIILSTGNIFDAAGPNEATGTATSFLNPFHVGDTDLADLANVNVNQVRDDAILEFDFVPLADTIQFEFVFASEEYCDYSNATSLYNDVFGFFLSGDGINGPFTDQAVNLAISPISNDAITVRNINHNVNFPFFIDNTPAGQLQTEASHIAHCALDVPRDGITSLLGQDGASVNELEYDGYTTVLVARMPVTPFQDYHLKIAIADIFDNTYDSAVFLKAGSFRAGQPTALIATPDTLTCAQSTITLDGSASTQGADILYTWSTTDGQILAGEDSDQPTIGSPGTYQLIVSRQNTVCRDTTEVSVIFANDLPQIQQVTGDTLTCDQTISNIQVTIDSPSLYMFSMRLPNGLIGSAQASRNFTSATAGVHTFYAESAAGCIDSMTFNVIIDTLTSGFIADSFGFGCNNDTLLLTPTFQGDVMSYAFSWRTADGSIRGNANAFSVIVSGPGNYTIEAKHTSNGCKTDQIYTVYDARNLPSISAGPDVALTCAPEHSLQGIITDPTGNETIDWIAVNGSPIMTGADALQPTITDPDTYILRVTNEFGCQAHDSVIISPNQNLPVLSVIRHDSIIDCRGSEAIINISIDKPISTINWSSDDGRIDGTSSDGLEIRASLPGTYEVRMTDIDGCDLVHYFELKSASPPNAVIQGDTILSCDDRAEISVLNFDENNMRAVWWEASMPDEKIEGNPLTVALPGQYTVQLEDINTGCTSEANWTIKDIFNEVSYTLTFEECRFNQGLFSIKDDAQSAVEALYINGILKEELTDLIVKHEDSLAIQINSGCTQRFVLYFDDLGPLGVDIITPEIVYYDEAFLVQAQTNRNPTDITSVLWTGLPAACEDCLSFETVLDDRQRVTVAVEDVYGCKSENYLWIDPQYRLDYFIPNAFTPNDDGVNDLLEIFSGKNVVGIETMNIYDRWGNRVFSQTCGTPCNGIISWDGTMNGKQAQAGAYIVEVLIRTARQTTYRALQDVLLIR